MIALAVHAEGVVLPVLAQPGARRNAILGERAGACGSPYRPRPRRGKANEAIQSVLAGGAGLSSEPGFPAVRSNFTTQAFSDRRDRARGAERPRGRHRHRNNVVTISELSFTGGTGQEPP